MRKLINKLFSCSFAVSMIGIVISLVLTALGLLFRNFEMVKYFGSMALASTIVFVVSLYVTKITD